MKRFGIDIGSLSIGTALLDGGKIVSATYKPHRGQIYTALKELLHSAQAENCPAVGVTGNFLSGKNGVLDNTLCVIEGAHFIAPRAGNIFSVGGQHFLLAFYDERGRYREHTPTSPAPPEPGVLSNSRPCALG